MRVFVGRCACGVLCGVAFLLLPRALAAQGTGTLTGVITAADSHEPVRQACIALEPPRCSGLSDSRGRYRIRGISAGRRVVTITAIGSAPAVDTVEIASGATSTLDVALEPGPLLLSGIVVTATRAPTEAEKVATTVDVLSPEHIATNPARESQDLLREIPGVELARTSSLVGGSAQIVSIRGVDEGRTAVLMDGFPVNDAWGEWIDWGRVPKAMLDHVEVVEGGTSNLYGNGAIGGVISFFSRPLPPLSTQVTVDAGSREARHVFVAGGVPLVGPLHAYASGDYLDGGGYTLLDAAKRGAVDVPSGIIQRNGHVRLELSPTGRWSGFLVGHVFNDARSLGTPLSFGSRRQHDVDLGVNYGAVTTGRVQVRAWDGHQDEFQRATAIRANSSSCVPSSTAARQCEDSSSTARIPSTDRGASVVWTREGVFGFQALSLGGDYRHMAGEYDETDFNTTCPGATCGSVVRTIASGGDQNLSGVFGQAILAPLAPLRVELGLRFDRWENNNGHSNDPIAGDTTYANRSKNALSPRVGVRYALSSRVSVHTAYYHAFRAPNLAELYRKQINASASQITIPNPDLRPETGDGFEVGLNLQPSTRVQLKGTAYVANYHQFNSPVVIDPGPPSIRQRLNINKSRSKGAELYVGVRPVDQLVVSAAASYDDARVVSNDSTNGQHIRRVPSPRYTLRATYTSPVLGQYTVMWRHEGKTTTLQGLSLAPFSVLDASAQRDLVGGLAVFVAAENIGNVQYQVNISGSGTNELISYGLPRTIRAGLSWVR
jgi:outer membrane receptor protein involved in Fe transport